MSNNSFSRTRRQRDFVSLQLCLYLYPLCNGRQFEYMEPSDFVSFLNLRRGADGVVRDREKLRVIYLIQASRRMERGNAQCLWHRYGIL